MTDDIKAEETKVEEPKLDEAPKKQEEPEPASQNQPAKLSQEKNAAQEPNSPTAQKPNDQKGAQWYVVHTYSGHETKVAATLKQRVESQKLEDKILDILVPTQEKIEIKEGKKATVKEKIFPGYLLIKMVLDDNTWLAVRTTPGITSFVGNANRPTPLPEDEVASIKKFMAMEAPKFKTTFTIGEAVKITDGPFSEFLGSVNEIDNEKGKLKVMVSIFGRETPVELDFLQVAKL
ncbi:transcription termination/antitermination factor NusG [Candidatus Curtissbacteria bacterium]|nr:transcription termination/antitermination factor NusG [Candidatus Curtissbacteria bacterium]